VAKSRPPIKKRKGSWNQGVGADSAPHAGTMERLNKFLARAGAGSRRRAEQLIRERRVSLNGRVVEDPAVRVDPEKDHVRIDGRPVSAPSSRIYLVYHKPRNVVSTMEDPQGRPCVGDVLRKFKGNPVPAGRLDFDAEGLLLCTNDGDLIQRLLHPRYHIQRIYRVKVKGLPESRALEKIEQGMFLDGARTIPARVRIIKRGAKNSWLSLILYEGRNQQVKRMLEKLGHPVLKLKRVGFGPLRITGIPPGAYRKLSPSEVLKLKESLGD